MAVNVIDTIKPKGEFPVVEAVDVDVNGEKLTEVLEGLATAEDLENVAQLVNEKADKSELEEAERVINLKANKAEVDEKTDDLQTQINNIVTEIPAEAEVLQARGEYSTLNERLTTENANIKENLSQFEYSFSDGNLWTNKAIHTQTGGLFDSNNNALTEDYIAKNIIQIKDETYTFMFRIFGWLNGDYKGVWSESQNAFVKEEGVPSKYSVDLTQIPDFQNYDLRIHARRANLDDFDANNCTAVFVCKNYVDKTMYNSIISELTDATIKANKALKYIIPLEFETNKEHFFRKSDGTYVSASGTPYAVSNVVRIPEGIKKISIVKNAANPIVSQVTFLSEPTLHKDYVVETWSPEIDGEYEVIIPENANYVCFSNNVDGSGNYKGNPTVYITNSDITALTLSNNEDVAVMKKIVEVKGKSIDIELDYSINKEMYFRASDGRLIPARNTEYSISQIIPVADYINEITIKKTSFNLIVSQITFLNSDVLSTDSVVGTWSPERAGEYTVDIPEGTKFVVFGNDVNNQGEKTGEPKAALIIDSFKEYEFISSGEIERNAKLNLPNEYSLVVGDTFELFYHSIIDTFNPDLYEIMIKCDVGNAYAKRYIYTPAEQRTSQLTVTLYDNDHNLIDEKTVNLNAKAVPQSPATQNNVLYVGDSLAVNGVVANEFYRRLTGTSGNPVGNALNNIHFIGSQETADGARFEAYGGYSFDYYNNQTIMYNWAWITTNHDKTESEDQHSLYKDADGKIWKIETIENGRIKIIGNSVGRPLPSQSGVLTWYSGGTHHSDIVYSSYEIAPGNPFWSETKNKVDFAEYVSKLGESGLDYVYVLLGWNSYTLTDEVYKSQVLTFINNVKASYPNCKIVLLGLQEPSQDGTGHNYTPTETHTYWYQKKHMFRCNNLYSEIASENANVYFVNVAGQFDTEHNMQTAMRTVNNRNAETEVYQTNGVHPANTGYLQIADACYRDFISKLGS